MSEECMHWLFIAIDSWNSRVIAINLICMFYIVLLCIALQSLKVHGSNSTLLLCKTAVLMVDCRISLPARAPSSSFAMECSGIHSTYWCVIPQILFVRYLEILDTLLHDLVIHHVDIEQNYCLSRLLPRLDDNGRLVVLIHNLMSKYLLCKSYSWTDWWTVMAH